MAISMVKQRKMQGEWHEKSSMRCACFSRVTSTVKKCQHWMEFSALIKSAPGSTWLVRFFWALTWATRADGPRGQSQQEKCLKFKFVGQQCGARHTSHIRHDWTVASHFFWITSGRSVEQNREWSERPNAQIPWRRLSWSATANDMRSASKQQQAHGNQLD